LILGIETSCDETAAALVTDDGRAGVVARRLDAEDHRIGRPVGVRHMITASSPLSW
jgi:tRNA A37 threonylcarbamoyltransferase TsaD